jgi:hypothetical protein
MAWIGLYDKLAAEVVKSRDLEKELSEVKDSIQKENNKHETLRVTVRVVCNDLLLGPSQETSSLVVRTLQITDRACEITRHTLCFGVQQSFMIARSHYENIDLVAMSQGSAPAYNDDELERIEEMASAPA